MKYFISQPMSGKSNEEIQSTRDKIIVLIKERDPDAEIIDSFFKDSPHIDNPVYWLGKSLEKLSEADTCVFVDGWNQSRGCFIEYMTCVKYNIGIVFDRDYLEGA